METTAAAAASISAPQEPSNYDELSNINAAGLAALSLQGGKFFSLISYLRPALVGTTHALMQKQNPQQDPNLIPLKHLMTDRERDRVSREQRRRWRRQREMESSCCEVIQRRWQRRVGEEDDE
ncbi:hypothetical protein Sjap_017842 [Stephania japonica]|uniref:Uncharacterized protein n=1 Tax=Stephania japonica TaxID=461633 RepID=A0AAP0I6Y7_9MAGN